jgi:DNA-binding NarL/FixJ family response regulator
MQREKVHILVIEDNLGFLDELLKWLREDFGYQEIAISQNTTDAETKLQTPCDVVISDMRMERDDSGFTILDLVKKNNLSTVVIILTANDTVADCRRAFREGAWDYISKNMQGNTFEALDDSIQSAIAYLDRWGNRPNQQWFEENREILETNYWGQWIAIINKTVIESADTEQELLKRLEERKLRRFTTTIQSVGDLRPITNLIALGESNQLEFKSTLQWDVREDKENKGLQKSCLKTIAAFLNSEGGVLLIGVRDDGSLFGLEPDLKCLSNGSLDKFERHIIQLIENIIGKRFLIYIRIQFANLEGKDVCGIYIRKAERKAFLKSEKNSEFYIRTGNSTKQLNVPDIYDHFG